MEGQFRAVNQCGVQYPSPKIIPEVSHQEIPQLRGVKESPSHFFNTNKAKIVLLLFMGLSTRVSLKNKGVSLVFPSPFGLWIGWTWLGSNGIKV